jgi:hypothetical protein
MICRAAVQDRLKIRLSALVALPFEKSGLLRPCAGLKVSVACPHCMKATWVPANRYFSDKLLQPNLRRTFLK